jgi:hypothetical protein
LERLAGIEPPKEFVVSFNIVSAVKVVKDSGRVPVIDFEINSILVITKEEEHVTPLKEHLFAFVEALQSQEGTTVAIFVEEIRSQIKSFSTS